MVRYARTSHFLTLFSPTPVPSCPLEVEIGYTRFKMAKLCNGLCGCIAPLHRGGGWCFMVSSLVGFAKQARIVHTVQQFSDVPCVSAGSTKTKTAMFRLSQKGATSHHIFVVCGLASVDTRTTVLLLCLSAPVVGGWWNYRGMEQ